MIDFRYHLVSLISVFMALAVGIALGAGPLQESIGDTLTGQVEQLRTERAELRTELDVSQADLRRADAALDAVAADLLDGVLAERRVAVVAVDDVPEDVEDAVAERLGQAGATVTAVVRLADEWVEPGQNAFRQSLAGRLVEYLDPRPADDAGTETELVEALVQGLTTADPEDPDAIADEAALSLELLQEGALVQLQAPVTQAADAVVVLVGPVVSAVQAQEVDEELRTGDPEEVAAQTERQEALARNAVLVASVAQARSTGAVLAGGDAVGQGVLEQVRTDQDTGRRLSTVESVQRTSGQVALPLALAARIAGEVSHVGAGAAADRAMPSRTVLPPVQRVPETEPDETDDAGTGTEEDQEAEDAEGTAPEDAEG